MFAATLPRLPGKPLLHLPPAPPRVPAHRQFDSRTLFGSAQEVRIEHFGQEYRLRQTRNGKLILTK